MAKRNAPHQSFGVYLRELRRGKSWTQSDVARYAKRDGLAVTRQQLIGLEKGQTKAPAPHVLRDLATLYGVPYRDIAAEFIAKQFGLAKDDLPRHANDVGLAPQPTEGSRHVADVRRMRARFEGLRSEVREVVVALSRVLDKYPAASADVPSKLSRTSGPKPRGGGRR